MNIDVCRIEIMFFTVTYTEELKSKGLEILYKVSIDREIQLFFLQFSQNVLNMTENMCKISIDREIQILFLQFSQNLLDMTEKSA